MWLDLVEYCVGMAEDIDLAGWPSFSLRAAAGGRRGAFAFGFGLLGETERCART